MDIDIDNIAHEAGFEMPAKDTNIIKVIGVGGGGNNAVNYMFNQHDIEGVSFVVVNTDHQALGMSPVPTKVQLGDGLGAGGKPEVGQKKAEADIDKIEALFDDNTKMVFITAGMGGGTGTGAAPVVARVAHEHDVLSVGIVTIPFFFEGKKKISKALNGAREMEKHVDALLIINNERLIDIYPDLNLSNAFNKADDILAMAARSISQLITFKGEWNLDFQDVNTTLRNGGAAIISTGVGEGENRVTKALENAINSPLLRYHDIFSAKTMLFNIYYNPNSTNPLKANELNEISQFMANFTNELDNIVGRTEDPELGDEVKITVLAAGFDSALSSGNTMKPRQPHTVVEEPDNGTTNLDDTISVLYGDDKTKSFNQSRDAAQYVILSQDDINNDDLLDILRDAPAYKRDAQVKELIARKAAEAAAAEPQKPYGTTATQQPAPAKRNNEMTINF